MQTRCLPPATSGRLLPLPFVQKIDDSGPDLLLAVPRELLAIGKALERQRRTEPEQTVEKPAAKKPVETNKPERRKRKFPYRKVADIEAEIAEREKKTVRVNEFITVSELADTVGHKQVPVYFDQMVDDVFLSGQSRPEQAAQQSPPQKVAALPPV